MNKLMITSVVAAGLSAAAMAQVYDVKFAAKTPDYKNGALKIATVNIKGAYDDSTGEAVFWNDTKKTALSDVAFVIDNTVSLASNKKAVSPTLVWGDSILTAGASGSDKSLSGKFAGVIDGKPAYGTYSFKKSSKTLAQLNTYGAKYSAAAVADYNQLIEDIAKIDEFKSEIENLIGDIDKLNIDTAAEIAATKAAAETQIADIQAAAEKQIADIQEAADKTVEEKEAEANKVKADAEQAIADAETKAQDEIKKITDELTEVASQSQEKIDMLIESLLALDWNALQDIKRYLNENIDQAKRVLADAQDIVDTYQPIVANSEYKKVIAGHDELEAVYAAASNALAKAEAEKEELGQKKVEIETLLDIPVNSRSDYFDTLTNAIITASNAYFSVLNDIDVDGSYADLTNQLAEAKKALKDAEDWEAGATVELDAANKALAEGQALVDAFNAYLEANPDDDDPHCADKNDGAFEIIRKYLWDNNLLVDKGDYIYPVNCDEEEVYQAYVLGEVNAAIDAILAGTFIENLEQRVIDVETNLAYAKAEVAGLNALIASLETQIKALEEGDLKTLKEEFEKAKAALEEALGKAYSEKDRQNIIDQIAKKVEEVAKLTEPADEAKAARDAYDAKNDYANIADEVAYAKAQLDRVENLPDYQKIIDAAEYILAQLAEDAEVAE